MASSPFLALFLVAAALAVAGTQTLAQPVAPGPTAAPNNITAILAKGGQYTTFIRLLRQSRVDEQINSQLNNSFNGLTVFAPTDNAFNSLKPGTLNSLTQQEQIELVLYHVLPRFYSLALFATTSNPVNTQASGNNGVYTMNITTTTNQVNISTGVVVTPITNSLSTDFPLAVYSVEKVLLPYDIFGPKPPAAAPAPKPTGSTKSPPSAISEGPSTDSKGSGSDSSGVSFKLQWSSLVGLGVMGVIATL
ncbi:fasciclin-like arabinogalactan protein 9 [Typha angustifolia]|uniref:fasciclin-like arabinogalactan protein 9 n=1 Tax=Typha angustifolia TaxID=59011 RepID=UPI003C2C390E